jgi:hypothetical protein
MNHHRAPEVLLASAIGSSLMRRLILAALLATSLFSSSVLRAQAMDVPVAKQVSILLKVISFDRQLRTRAPHSVVVGVVYQGGNRASVIAKNDAMRAFRTAKSTLEGLPLRAVAIDLDHDSLAIVLRPRTFTHLYLAPLGATDVRAIAQQARDAHVTTMTGVVRYLDDGIALSVGFRGGRPRILVNLETSRLEGANLSAEVLKLAEFVQ